MSITRIAKFIAASALSVAAYAGNAPAPQSLAQAEQQARAEGKFLVVALCPGTAAQCAPYYAAAQQALGSVMFRNSVVFSAPDVTKDEAAYRLLNQYVDIRRPRPAVLLFDLNINKLWASSGDQPAAKIASDLNFGACWATLHEGAKAPASFLNQNRTACEELTKGSEVIRPVM